MWPRLQLATDLAILIRFLYFLLQSNTYMPEKQYTEEDVERAVEAVQAKVPISRAARLWGIPRTTLRRRLTGSVPVRQSQE